jgi:hypothetical protein
MNIYRKPTTTDTIIHFRSNHPLRHKIAAFRFLLNRMHLLPLDQQQKHNEWLNILHIAEINGYPTSIIHKLNTQIQNRVNKPPKKTELPTKKWITFTFHNPRVRKIINLFRNTNLKIAFKTNNSIQWILNIHERYYNQYSQNGIYRMICHTCISHI